MGSVLHIHRFAAILSLALYSTYFFSQTGQGFTSLQAAAVQPEKVKSLNLRKTGLTSIPSEVFLMTNLEELILEKNEITKVPDEIGLLTKLRILDIDQNKLTSVSPAIGKLKQLKELDLDKNQLTELPEEIANLDSLTNLDLRYNELKKLPSGIGKLKKLRFLWLSYNKLSDLPAEIGELTNLYQIRAENNLLSTLPPEIGKIDQLNDLFIFGNPFKKLPAEIKNLKALHYFSISKRSAELLPEEILLNDLLSEIIFSAFESSSGRIYASHKELTDLILKNSKHDDFWKTQFRLQLKKRDIPRSIISNGDGDFICNKENKSMLATLAASYSINECIELTNHASSYVRIFAVKVLDQKKFNGLFEIAKKHISDAEYVHHKDYCSSAKRKFEKAGDYFMDIKSISATQRKLLDSMLIFENNKLTYTKLLIEKLNTHPRFHQRMREIVFEHSGAIEKLTLYRDSTDIPILKEAIKKNEWAVRYLKNFPHPAFRELILELRKKKRDFFQYNYEVIASFQDTFALRLLKQDILFEEDPTREGKPKKEYHYPYYSSIYDAVHKYRCPLYNELLCMLWERYTYCRKKELFDYIQKNDEEQALDIAKSTLIKLQGYGDDTSTVKRLISFVDSKEPKVAEEILAKKLLLVESNTRELSFSSASLKCMLNYSAKFKSPEIQKARFTLLANSEYNSICVDIVKLILSLNEPEQNKELLKVLSKKRNTAADNATAIKKLLLQKNLLNELISISEKLPDDEVGIWFIDSIKPAGGNYLVVPSWATITIRSDSVYSFKRCECESEGFVKIPGNSLIHFDTVQENFPRFYTHSIGVANGFLSRRKGAYHYQVPMLATSAVSIPIIEGYCDNLSSKDSAILKTYEEHFYTILKTISSYSIQNDTMILKGKGEIRLLLIGNFRTDWHYPVAKTKKLPARFKTPQTTPHSILPNRYMTPARGTKIIKKKSP